MSTLTVRAIPEGDVWLDCHRLLQAVHRSLTLEQFRTWTREAERRDGYTMYGAFDAGQLVGVMGMRLLWDLRHGRHLVIDDLVVDGSVAGAAVIERLLAAAEQRAAEAGGLGLRVSAPVASETGALFEAAGWRRTASEYARGFDG
ncbi:MAG: GNAT family N-acetyltransferase [Gemmatimonadaceae bacterium]|jgi:GNAT superfamily N-acetyltransferase|nr:GNAT family N-acetyltransferase [Gemmatimonadaceae bacterium]